MPRQGNTVESCTILSWSVSEGDPVDTGTVLCEVETDKATFEVESPESGTVLAILHEEGDDVPVLRPIAVVGSPGEAVPPELARSETTARDALPGDASLGDGARIDEAAAGGGPVSPKRGPDGGVDPVKAAGDRLRRESGRTAVSPLARRIARSAGVDTGTLVGTGPHGRVIRRDVEAAVAVAADGAEATRETTVAVKSGSGGRGASGLPRVQPLSVVRRRIGEKMLASLNETAQLTMDASADARALRRARARLKETGGKDAPTINDLLLYAVGQALVEHPEMNAHLTENKLTVFPEVNIGFAVDTERGLYVPVVSDVARRTVTEIARETRRLSRACMDGSISPDDLADATFTVTNLGALGVEHFTPILNPPQVGILGVGAIVLRPVEESGAVSIVPRIGLSLTFDHRATDGAPAARFLKRVADEIAHIDGAAGVTGGTRA